MSYKNNIFKLGLLTGIGKVPTEELDIEGNAKATSFIGSGSQLTGVVKTTGETTQIINSSIVEVLGTATTAIIRASSSAGARISLFQSGETSFIQSNKSTDSFGRIVMSGSGGQPLEYLRVRIDGSFTEKNIYHEGNLASSPTGVLADNSVQLTGETSQTINGELVVNGILKATNNGIHGPLFGDLNFKTLGNSDNEGFLFRDANNLVVASIFRTGAASFLSSVTATSFIAPLITIVENTNLTVSNSEVIIDAASQAVTAILPTVASVPVNKRYTVIAYDAANTITLATSSSQQIRQIKTDNATSLTLTAGDIYTVTNTGTYWQIISKQ